MPRLTKIYTRKGDEGMTSLSGGQRVAKDSLRVSAYGWVDEVNSILGVALAHGLSPRLATVVPTLQNELFHLGSDLSFIEDDKEKFSVPQIEARHVARLESLIDELNEIVGPAAELYPARREYQLCQPAPRADGLPPCRARCCRAGCSRASRGADDPLSEPPLRRSVRDGPL
jgi:hypothetical protein